MSWEGIEPVGTLGESLSFGIVVTAVFEVVRGLFLVSIPLLSLENDERPITSAYGPPRAKGRKDLWDELEDLYGLCDSRWCICGDFNVLHFLFERG